VLVLENKKVPVRHNGAYTVAKTTGTSTDGHDGQLSQPLTTRPDPPDAGRSSTQPLCVSHFDPTLPTVVGIKNNFVTKQYELEAKDVLPNINRTQAA